MKVSAFIRSYAGDFEWLQYCLLSLEKNGQELHEIVVAVPKNDLGRLRRLQLGRAIPVGVRTINEAPYIDQQICKIHADEHCAGDCIMHLDSDCMAIDQIKLDGFFDRDRPKLLFRKWEDCGDAQCWKPITKNVLSREPSFEFMACLPIIYHKSSHELFRRYVEQVRQCEFDAYAANLTMLSEFNAIGNFCHLYTPDAYSFVRATGPADGYPRPLRQFWSHAPINHAEMKALL